MITVQALLTEYGRPWGLSITQLIEILSSGKKVDGHYFWKFTTDYSIYFTLYIITKRENFIPCIRILLQPQILTLYFVTHSWHHVIKTSHPHSRSYTCSHILTLIIALSRLHSLAFHSSLLHIASLIKFNYYLITLIIGRVTHPLTPLSSTSK